VDHRNSKLLTESDQWFIFERCSIIGDNSTQKTKACYDILKEANDYLVGCAPYGDSFYQLGKIICGHQDPSMLTVVCRMNLPNEV
jgi:hypothetical protein